MINRESEGTYQSVDDANNKLNEELMGETAPPPPKPQRLASLDILRGLTIIGMLMVDDW